MEKYLSRRNLLKGLALFAGGQALRYFPACEETKDKVDSVLGSQELEPISDSDALFVIGLFQQNLSYTELKASIDQEFQLTSLQEFHDLQKKFLAKGFLFDLEPEVGLTFLQFKDYSNYHTSMVPSFAPFDDPNQQIGVKEVIRRWGGRSFLGLTIGFPGQDSIIFLDLNNIKIEIQQFSEQGKELEYDNVVSNTLINEIAHFVFNQNMDRFKNSVSFRKQLHYISELYSDFMMLQFGFYQDVEIMRLLNLQVDGYRLSINLMKKSCMDVLGKIPTNQEYYLVHQNTKAIVERFLTLSGLTFQMLMN